MDDDGGMASIRQGVLMIETTNPEIDVNQLMERIHQEAAKVRPREHGEITPRARAPRSALPTIFEIAGPPLFRLSRPPDSKNTRTEQRLQKARRMIEVSASIPKIFRRFFRRQGGFNRAALETMNELAKANIQLSKRVGELVTAAEQQSQWLRLLHGLRLTEAAWMKTTGALVADIPAVHEKLADLERKLAASEELDDIRLKLVQLRESHIESEKNDTQTRQQLEGHAQHLRNLQLQSDHSGEHLRISRDEWDRAGQHLRNLQIETDRNTEQLTAAREQINRDGQHLRNLQAETSVRAKQHANLEAVLGRVEERHLNDSIYIKGEISRHNTLLQHRDVGAEGAGRKKNTEVKVGADQREQHRLDSFYLSFENRFRGTRPEIKKRVRFYLPLLAEVSAGTEERPILDVGCGRGEWLELLREDGLHAFGVDLNSAMIAQCAERELSVTEADAIVHLRSLPDESHGAVSGFHIIEHLPLEALIDLIAEIRRVLKPGGLAIFESPNCKNLTVGACNFNIDPTHRNPVFPETAQFMLETQGFESVRLEYLSRAEDSPFEKNGPNSAALDHLLYGPQDFAVIGRKSTT